MVDYIRSNPQCSHDLDMIIDLPTHHSLQLVKITHRDYQVI